MKSKNNALHDYPCLRAWVNWQIYMVRNRWSMRLFPLRASTWISLLVVYAWAPCAAYTYRFTRLELTLGFNLGLWLNSVLIIYYCISERVRLIWDLLNEGRGRIYVSRIYTLYISVLSMTLICLKEGRLVQGILSYKIYVIYTRQEWTHIKTESFCHGIELAQEN